MMKESQQLKELKKQVIQLLEKKMMMDYLTLKNMIKMEKKSRKRLEKKLMKMVNIYILKLLKKLMNLEIQQKK